jgi:hypothetical protein
MALASASDAGPSWFYRSVPRPIPPNKRQPHGEQHAEEDDNEASEGVGLAHLALLLF